MDAIGKLTGGIAHDFNNLLAAVLGGIGLIERRAELGEEHRKILGMTKRAADQGSELVRRLLAFARRQQLQPASVDFEALHKGVDDLLSHTLGGLVELDWRLPEDGWRAFADRSQLELALMNLIINARDAMPDGGTIVITAGKRDVEAGNGLELAPGSYVTVEVTDRGSGIPADILEKVLEPFFTTKPVGKGTGLGLSMVYGFARQSGGTFRLRSDPGEGTRAEIWLPEASAQEQAVAVAAEHKPADIGPALKILLVDDHAEVRIMTAALLAELGHEVVEAPSGAEALNVLRRTDLQIDLLLSDYAMPHLSGTDIVDAARKLRPDLPALLVTGYADADEIGERPMDVAILNKPFTVPDLASALRKAVRSRAEAA
nr:ATP-binding protein [Sphingomonas arenae]